MDDINEANENQRLIEALLVSVHDRQVSGQLTTLRDLHGLLGVSQPKALRLASQVERDGHIVIEGDPMDRFASIVSLNPSKPKWFLGEARRWNPFAK
ncbi:MAG: hypothetical protein AAGB23_13310 [Pseudomonadota bacterium]